MSIPRVEVYYSPLLFFSSQFLLILFLMLVLSPNLSLSV